MTCRNTWLLFPLLASSLGTQAASPLDGWSWYGTNTLRVEDYRNGGDPAGAYYPHEGLQVFDELNLAFSSRPSAYEQVHGSFLGLLNDSEYRSFEEGLVIERAGVTWEKGDVPVPFRLQAGDYFGYLSYRTLQRPLKGLQFEVQPTPSGALQHSLLAFAGLDAPTWRDFDGSAPAYVGASWLMQLPRVGALGFNVVHSARDAEPAAGTDERRQSVFSVAGEMTRHALGQELLLEGEVGFLRGDTDAPGDAGQDRSDRGWFFQLSGRNASPFSYRLRHERYGEHYQPAGGSVPSDRESLEAHGTWRMSSGHRLRGRVTRFTDGLESGNSTDTDTVGLQLTGPFSHLGSGAIDAFVQSTDSEDGLVDRRVSAVSLNLGTAINADWTGGLSAEWRDNEDSAGDLDSTSGSLQLRADRRFALGDWTGIVSPDLTLRRVRADAGSTDDVGPGLGLAMERGPHALDLELGVFLRDQDDGGDVVDHRVAGRYAWRRDNHRVSFEVDYLGRDPDTAADSHGYRVAVTYSLDFDRPARQVVTAANPASGIVEAPATAPLDIVALAPGMPVAAVREDIAAAGFGAGVAGPGFVAWEAPLLDAIDLRQRLVVEHAAGEITRTALLIDFDDPADGSGAMRQFDEVRRVLLERYGPPSDTYERGEIDSDLATAIAVDRAIRLYEWPTAEGRLRFGIPRRLDGTVRMELQHATRLPSPRETLWSVDALR